MSQKGVEGLLGRLLTDSDFRRRFYQEPVAACVGEALDVTTRELQSVLALQETRIVQFSKVLDTRIVRAAVNAVSRRAKVGRRADPNLDVLSQQPSKPRQDRVRGRL